MRKGQKMPKEAIERMRLKLIGRKCLAGTFKKGNIPWNKGTKGITGIHPNCRATQFKKGHTSPNYAGGVRISDWGLEIDMGLKYPKGNIKYVPHARYVYEQTHKIKIPKGYVIIYKDKNKYNDTPENLEMISMKDNLYRNNFTAKGKIKCMVCGTEFETYKGKGTCSKKCYEENCKIKNILWRRKNADKVKECNRRCREKYADKRKEYSREYRKKHPERIKELNKKYRERQKTKKEIFIKGKYLGLLG